MNVKDHNEVYLQHAVMAKVCAGSYTSGLVQHYTYESTGRQHNRLDFA